MNSETLTTLLGGWASSLPATVRKRVYQTVKYAGAAATLLLLVLPSLSGLGLDPNDRYVAVATLVLTFVGHLASSNTITEPPVDMTPAPEVHPADTADAALPASPATEASATPEQPKKTNPSG